jgi:hypothetical protein
MTGTLNSGEDAFFEQMHQAQKARDQRDKCGCCECVTDVSLASVSGLTNFGGFGIPRKNSWGHTFSVSIGLTYRPNRDGESGEAQLSWKERTDKPTWRFGGQANTWVDLSMQGAVPSPVFAPWYMRQWPLTCTGGQNIMLTDSPAAPIASMPRTLDIEITVFSGCKSCPIPSKTLRLRQVLWGNEAWGGFGPDNVGGSTGPMGGW